MQGSFWTPEGLNIKAHELGLRGIASRLTELR